MNYSNLINHFALGSSPTVFNYSFCQMWVPAQFVVATLKRAWYTDPMTETILHYEAFRDMRNVDVVTLRFNLNSVKYSEEYMIDTLLKYVMKKYKKGGDIIGMIDYDLMKKYKKGGDIIGMIDYDLLLVSSVNPESFYIHTANSNQRSSKTQETRFSLSRDNLYIFARRALQINIPDLEINFQESKMVISSVIALVFTFVAS